MLVLLIVFMVTAPLLTVSIPIEMPHTEAKQSAAESDPHYRFHIEYVIFLDHYLRTHPGERARILRLIKAGQIEIGCTWAGKYGLFEIGRIYKRSGRELSGSTSPFCCTSSTCSMISGSLSY